jgi:outer membrane protease
MKYVQKCAWGMLLLLVLPLAAEEGAPSPTQISGRTFSAAVGFTSGVLVGQGEEIVYNYGNRLSQLLWDLKPLVYIGVDAMAEWRQTMAQPVQGVFVAASFKAGIPMWTGTMEDRDWMGYINSSYPAGPLTHYSIHNNKTRLAFLAGASTGLTLKPLRGFTFRPFIAYDYMYFFWEAWGGSFSYRDPWPSSKLGVAYTQQWHILSPGVSVGAAFKRHFSMELSFKITPLILCIARDDHVETGAVYLDTMGFGLFTEPRLVFTYAPNRILALSLLVSYRDISFTRGDTKITNTSSGATRTTKGTGGAGYHTLDAGIRIAAKLR